ncbi:MAG: metallophosphoesterase family protein [Thermoleophilaceae bacterium]
MRYTTLAAAAAIVLVNALAAVSPAAASKPKSHKASGGGSNIAVIGDTPYGQPQIDTFPDDIAELNADPDITRVIHLGDIKNGSSVCSTDYFQQIRADFDLFDKPLVYTPGDNEWTDCHRANNGGYQPAGNVPRGSVPSRLNEIRRIFFDRPGRTLGQPAAKVSAQEAPYVENVRWRERQALFATLDIPGSNNDKAPWFGTAETAFQKQQQAKEVSGRTAADLRWIDAAFDRAQRRRVRVVVLGIQADMWDPAITADPASYDGYTSIVKRLAARAREFRGPVLLLNGDSHQFTDDHPLADPARPENRSIYGVKQSVPNLRRITVNGSTTPCHEWLKLK